jgi:hypothetical protein
MVLSSAILKAIGKFVMDLMVVLILSLCVLGLVAVR